MLGAVLKVAACGLAFALLTVIGVSTLATSTSDDSAVAVNRERAVAAAHHATDRVSSAAALGSGMEIVHAPAP